MRTESINPFIPDPHGNPHPMYHRLRAEDPVHFNEMLEAWVLTRYEDIAFVLKDPRFSADRTQSDNFERFRAMRDDGGQLPPRSMLNSDPPDHSRLRNLVSKAFTPRHVEALRPRIHQIVDAICDEAGRKGGMEVISELAYPLPITVIAEMLGVPPEDRETFREWTSAIAVLLDPFPPDDLRNKGIVAAESLRSYFSGIIEQRRREPRDDLISGLIAAEEHGDVLTTEEMLTMCNLLLIAGHETTVNLIGNGLLALLRNPAELARLGEDPSLARPGVEELLRYDGPVGLTGRVATEHVEIRGKTIPPRQAVVTLLLAANRDPEQFSDPDRLVLDRYPNAHLAFGGGIHFCLGAPLARLEAQIALATLARRFPNTALANGEPEWKPLVVLRGVSALEVTVG